jgi:N utilization substance protein B
VRARALQLLYAREFHDEPIRELAERLVLLGIPRNETLTRAVALAEAVTAGRERLDDEIAQAVEHWRPQRVGLLERNILRLALHELRAGATPPRVAISEAVALAHRFAGPRAPAFVNGVLDGLARRAGRL